MSEQLIQLLEEATCDDDIHDVEFIVSYMHVSCKYKGYLTFSFLP